MGSRLPRGKALGLLEEDGGPGDSYRLQRGSEIGRRDHAFSEGGSSGDGDDMNAGRADNAPVVQELVNEALQEVMERKRQKDDQEARRTARQKLSADAADASSSGEEQADPSQPPQQLRSAGMQRQPRGESPYVETVRRWGWVARLRGTQPEAPPSSSERKALGDEWYIERSVVCAACTQPVRGTRREMRGVRCVGCGRWYHDACAPPGTLPQLRGEREEDPLTCSYYHCGRCRQVRAALAAAAAEYRREGEGAAAPPAAAGSAGGLATAQPRAQQPGSGSSSSNPLFSLLGGLLGSGSGGGGGLREGDSLVLVDLAEVRAALKAAPSAAAGKKGGGDSKSEADRREPRDSGQVFQRIPRYQLRKPSALGDVYSSVARAGKGAGGEGAGNVPGLSDARKVVALLRQYDPDEVTEEVLEDSWAALLVNQGRPVCGATLRVCGDDHARLQSLATSQSAVRQGHATALVRELQGVLARAGVPRLVAVLPASPPHPGGVPLLTRKLGLQPLEDMGLLAAWKAQWRSYYATELLGKGAQIFTKKLPAAALPEAGVAAGDMSGDQAEGAPQAKGGKDKGKGSK